MNHRDALSLILENVMLILTLSLKFLTRLFRSKSLTRLDQITMTFKKYMTDILEKKKSLMTQKKSRRDNLMTSLIRASNERFDTTDQNKNTQNDFVVTHSRDELIENEIYDNMFVFSFASHDTIAHTLTFTIYLLAAHSAIQDWLRKELQYYLSHDVSSLWSYQEIFLKLRRCLVVLVSILVYRQSWEHLSSLRSLDSISEFLY